MTANITKTVVNSPSCKTQGHNLVERNLKVAYIFHRFPRISEAFMMREMYWIREQGVDVHIFSLLSPKSSLIHDQFKELLLCTHYGPFISWDVLKAQFHFLRRTPGRYLKALGRAIWQTYREPRVLLGILAIFPKSVYFARQMQEAEIEHIHAHFVWLGGIAAGVASDLIDITFSIQPHAFGLFGRNQRDVRCELENASQVVTISNYHRAYIDNLCPRIEQDQIQVVYSGLEIDRFQPLSKPPGDGPVRILSVGRLLEKKGYEYLIDACALLAKRGVAFQCQIAGDGYLKDTLQARINQHGLQDEVILLGSLAQKQVLNLYQNSDIFALACVIARDGDRDGIPGVLIEAMACQVPVVTTPVAGIPDLVQHGENGLFVEERNVPGLADALQRLILDENLRRQMGEQARQTIVEGFQIQHNVAKLAAIFRKVSKQEKTSLDGTIAQ